MGDFAPEQVSELINALNRIANALESSPIADIHMEIKEIREFICSQKSAVSIAENSGGDS